MKYFRILLAAFIRVTDNIFIGVKTHSNAISSQYTYRALYLPAMWGAANEVPLIVCVGCSSLYHVEVMLEPGAKMSTQDPQLEKLERVSLLSMAPTVIAYNLSIERNKIQRIMDESFNQNVCDLL